MVSSSVMQGSTEFTKRSWRDRSRSGLTMLDAIRLQTARWFLDEMDNEVEALEQLDTLSPEGQRDPVCAAVRLRCQVRARRRWRAKLSLAQQIARSNPRDQVGARFRDYAERMLSEATAALSKR